MLFIILKIILNLFISIVFYSQLVLVFRLYLTGIPTFFELIGIIEDFPRVLIAFFTTRNFLSFTLNNIFFVNLNNFIL